MLELLIKEIEISNDFRDGSKNQYIAEPLINI